MKYATKHQIIEAAKAHGSIGRDSVRGMYTVTTDGTKKYFGRQLYRDSLANLASDGILKYTGEWLYKLGE